MIAQQQAVVIDNISIEGNKKTRSFVILRELKFKLGDTIAVTQLSDIINESRDLVMNTGLFNKAEITFKNWEGVSSRVHILISVEEAWYIYPVPIFELADRNFNVWWVEQKRSLQRINFGVEFTHLNFTGRSDRLKVNAKYGYTRSYGLKYNLPYINKDRTLGIFTEVSYSRNREINYITIDNKQEFYIDEQEQSFLFKRFWSVAGLSYRPALRAQHEFYLGYHQNTIPKFVAEDLNPDFFLNGRHLQRYFNFRYKFSFDKRDVRPYPTEGYYLFLELEKAGLGIFPDRNGLTFKGLFDQYLPFTDRWSLAMEAQGKLSLIRSQQPYNDNRALGFSRNFMRGYEYYVVDGLDLAVGKSTLRYKVLDVAFNFGKIVPIKAFREMPFKVYLTLNGDIGYVNGPYVEADNFLNNRLLYSGGVGINFVLYYDKVLQINYSLNQLKEAGLFLHLNLNI